MMLFIFTWIIQSQISGIWSNPLLEHEGMSVFWNPVVPNTTGLILPPAVNLKPAVKTKYLSPNFQIPENVDPIMEDTLLMLLLFGLDVDEHVTAKEEMAVIKGALCGSEKDYVHAVRKEIRDVCDSSYASATECFGREDATKAFWQKSTVQDKKKLSTVLVELLDELLERKRNLFRDVKDKRVDGEPHFREESVGNFIKREITGKDIAIPEYLKKTKTDYAIFKTACALGIQREELFKYYLQKFCKNS